MTEEYREGNEEVEAPEEKAEETSPSPKVDAPSEETGPQPTTAFLVMAFPDGRVDAVTKLPGLSMEREATIRDIRDLTHALHLDTVVTMNIQGVSAAIGQSLAQAAQKQMVSHIQDRMSRRH